MSDQNESLPPGWVEVALEELGTWVGGGTPSKSNPAYWAGGDVPWVSPKDMVGLGLSGTRDHITALAARETAARLFPAGSIAFVVRSGILARTIPIALIPFEAAANQDMRVLTPHPGLNVEWLLWALIGSAEAIRRTCGKHGTTVASIDATQLKSYRIPVPPRAEQDRIVEALQGHLAALESGERNLNAAYNRLETYLRALLRDELSADEERPLGEIAQISSGVTKGRRTKEGVGPRPFLRAANLRDGYLDLEEVKTIEATQTDVAKYRLQHGDVLMVEGSGSAHRLGQGWLWEDQVEGCIHQNHVFRARPARAAILPRFLAWTLQSPRSKSYFSGVSKTTSGLSTMNRRQVADIPIPLPPLNEQARIVHRLDLAAEGIRRLTRELEEQAARVGELRRSLTHHAFTGRLVPQDPSDEPASELLARVEAERASRKREHQAARRDRRERNRKTRSLVRMEGYS